MKHNKASVLMLSLWALSLLTFFAVSLGSSVSQHLKVADHLQDRMKMYYLARAGIELGINELEMDDDKENDNFTESWASDEEIFKNKELGDGYITIGYESIDYQESEESQNTILYGIEDESSKININAASEETLKNLLMNVGDQTEEDAIFIASAIRDWIDDEAAGSFEDEFYSRNKDYDCKDSEVQAIEELFLVEGMNPDIFSKIKDSITIFGDDKVNVNTATLQTLSGMGADPFADEIINARNGADGVPGTEDDGEPFASKQDILDVITYGLSGEEGWLNNLKYNSDTFRITSYGHLKEDSLDGAMKIECVVKRGQEPEMLYWHEE